MVETCPIGVRAQSARVTSTAVPRPYHYRCEDASPISAWISRVVAPPIQRRLPRGVTANQVTVFGSVLLWIALAGALATPLETRRALAPLWVLLLWSYCVLDHVDGVHARATSNSSRLGEYLDHALDAWNVAAVIGVVAAVSLPAIAPRGLVALAGAGGLAAVVTWLDQRAHGCIRLGRVGPVEGVLLAGVFVLTWANPTIAAWWAGTAGGLGTRADAVMWLSTGATVASSIGALLRLGALRWRVGLVAAQLLVALGGVWLVPNGWLPVLLTVSAMPAIYCGRIISSHLAETPVPLQDWMGLPLTVAIVVSQRLGLSAVWLSVPLAWLAFQALRGIANSCRRFGVEAEAIRHLALRTAAVARARDGIRQLAPRSVEPSGHWTHEVTVIVKTFERPTCILPCLTSIRARFPALEILVCDDSHEPLFTDGTEPAPGIRWLTLPAEAGHTLGAGRNHLVRHVRTPLFFLADDDHAFTPATRIDLLYAILRRHDLDIVGGAQDRGDYGGAVFQQEGDVVYQRFHEYHEELEPGVVRCDRISNTFLARTERVRAIGWEERVHGTEHADFFLRASRAGLRIAQVGYVYVDHRRDWEIPVGWSGRWLGRWMSHRDGRYVALRRGQDVAGPDWRAREVEYVFRKNGIRTIVDVRNRSLRAPLEAKIGSPYYDGPPTPLAP